MSGGCDRALLAWVLAGILGAGTAAAATLDGRVAAEGAPITGAMVTARSHASGIQTTVLSDASGRFRLGGLIAGSYEVGVTVPGKRAEPQLVELDGERDTPLHFEVVPNPDFLTTLPSAAWLELLPDGDMKREFVLNCASCHEISYPRVTRNGRPRSVADWSAAIALMRAIDVYGLTPPDFEDARYAEWLARHLGDGAIARLRPEPLPRGAVLDARITEYPVPETPSLPHDIAVGPDGRVWITAFYNNAIWELDPATGAVRAYPVNDTPEVMGQVRALCLDGGGLLWVLLGGTRSLVRLDPADGSVQTFPVEMYPHSIELDSRGHPWFNDYISATERIGRLDPGSGQLSLHAIPSAGLSPAEGLPLLYGLQIDRDDVVWGTMLAANKLFRFDPRSEEARLFDLPEPNSGPRRPAVGLDGAIWIPEFNTGFLTRFDPDTRTFARHDLGRSTLGPYDAAVDPRSGHVWVAAALGSALIRFDPATAERDVYPLPTEPAYSRHIAIDPRNGDVWTTYSSMPDAKPKIVRIEVRGAERDDSGRPAARRGAGAAAEAPEFASGLSLAGSARAR